MAEPVSLTWQRDGADSAVARSAGVRYEILRRVVIWRHHPYPSSVLFELRVVPFFNQGARYVMASADLHAVMAAAGDWAATFARHKVAA
ncbi:MAG: hypothetical protein AAFY75_04155 [Pseudomonadota bacterium]